MIRFLTDIFELFHIMIFSVIVSLLTGLVMFCLAIEDTLLTYAKIVRMKSEATHPVLYSIHKLVEFCLNIVSLPFTALFSLFKILIELTLGASIDYEILVHSSCDNEEAQ